jgi:hypothetical protein
MKEPVVVAQSHDHTAVAVVDNASGWKYLFLVGAGITIVGLIDLSLLFFPARFANLDWEFGTISGLFDAMPLMTLGIGLMSAAAVANGWTGTRRLVVVLALVMTVVVALLGTIFALDVPAVLKAVEPGMRPSIKRASLKTGLMSLTYFVLYLALGVWTWRRLRAMKGARG